MKNEKLWSGDLFSGSSRRPQIADELFKACLKDAYCLIGSALNGVNEKFSRKSHHRYRGAALELFKGSLYPYSLELSTFQATP